MKKTITRQLAANKFIIIIIIYLFIYLFLASFDKLLYYNQRNLC